MTDREKVIKQLEECISASCRGFRTCPYSDNAWDAVREALALLREHEPVKPVNVRWVMNIRGGTCPRCLNWVQRSYNYCPFCGKAVNWDAVD